MKAMLHAATMVVSIGTSSAYADEDDGYSATTLFTLIPGERPSLAATAPGGADCGRGRRSGAQLCDHEPPRHVVVPAGPARRRLIAPPPAWNVLRLSEPNLALSPTTHWRWRPVRRVSIAAALALGLVALWAAILPLAAQPVSITQSPAMSTALFLCRTQRSIDHTCAAALANALIMEQLGRDATTTADRACHTDPRTLLKEGGSRP